MLDRWSNGVKLKLSAFYFQISWAKKHQSETEVVILILGWKAYILKTITFICIWVNRKTAYWLTCFSSFSMAEDKQFKKTEITENNNRDSVNSNTEQLNIYSKSLFFNMWGFYVDVVMWSRVIQCTHENNEYKCRLNMYWRQWSF